MTALRTVAVGIPKWGCSGETAFLDITRPVVFAADVPTIVPLTRTAEHATTTRLDNRLIVGAARRRRKRSPEVIKRDAAIVAALRRGHKQRAVARRFGVSQPMVSRIWIQAGRR